ncbi:MAG: MFS transporter [Alphaproteobacteria bacterium]|nr:MFS transporter [Alphaproteobacteria bacterium]
MPARSERRHHGAMRQLAPLANPAIARLWSALALTAVGEELVRVALTWIAVDLIGTDAPYLWAVQASAMLVGAAFGGRFLDRRDPRLTMIWANVLRAAAVLVPVALWAAGALGIWALVVPAALLSLLRSQFEPAMLAALPRLAADPGMLFATNGLVDMVNRVARLVGPGLAGPLASLVAIPHFFTIHAAILLVAAALIASLARALPRLPAAAAGGAVGLRAGWQALRADPPLALVLAAAVVSNTGWVVGIPLGLALLIDQRQPSWLGIEGVGAYGFLLTCYSVSNITANFISSSLPPPLSLDRLYAGNSVLGFGVALMGGVALLAPEPLLLPLLVPAMMVASSGSPFHDLPLLYLIQRSGPSYLIASMFRYRLIATWLGILLGSLAAPPIFRWLEPAGTILAMGVFMLAGALLAWAATRAGLVRKPPPQG